MVDYITAKLRKDKFEKLLKGIQDHATIASHSKNRMIGACVFFTHFYLTHAINDGKTLFQLNNEMLKKKPEETMICLMRKYYEFLGDNEED